MKIKKVSKSSKLIPDAGSAFFKTATGLVLACCSALHVAAQGQPAVSTNALPNQVILPLERTAYFIGETVPMVVTGSGPIKLEAVNADGRVLLYQGPEGPLWVETAKLAAGDYTLVLNGSNVISRVTLTSTLRKSPASMQDEWTPNPGWSSDETDQIFQESGLSACVNTGAGELSRVPYLDAMARSGAMLLVNSDTRPTSFLPVGNSPDELDGMSQRMILTAQANGCYPNFGGFCFAWDTTGFAVGGRRMLLTYWGWGDQTGPLRKYIDRHDQFKMDEFTRRTGLKPVTEAEYISYLVSIRQPELAPVIDLPTKLWLEEIARYSKPIPEADRVAFEKRLDLWSGYLMGLYNENYTRYVENLRSVDSAMRFTGSVQVDHSPVRQGQNFPSAYAPLDFQYQSTWNDQVSGPDYAYQGLFVESMLDMGRKGRPTWISNAHISAHDRSSVPGKFTRVAAHGLAFGGSGIGFALEGFSNLLGGMAGDQSSWKSIKGKSGGSDVLAGKDFLDRFAALAVTARGDHGVGILWSQSQYGRQNVCMGYGTTAYKALVTLTRLGYTPRFVTEEELTSKSLPEVRALVILSQTVPLPAAVQAGLEVYRQKGGRILVDGSTSITIAGSEKLDLSFPFTLPGKPHSWGAPNMIGNQSDVLFANQWVQEYSPVFYKTLGTTGHSLLTSEKGASTQASLMQIDGGQDAKYIVAVNDSFVLSQADWNQVQEKLTPTHDGWLYDCTEEKSLGAAAPFVCDLAQTTARVFAFLPRELRSARVAVTQSLRAGTPLQITVEFLDADGKPLAAVLPFHLSVIRPDGKAWVELYRSTTRDGLCTLSLDFPANVPTGKWSVAIRSQLTGGIAELPVTVSAAKVEKLAMAMDEPAVVRDRAAIEKTLVKGASLTLPVFDAKLLPAAQRVKDVLARRGVTVTILEKPAVGTWVIAYDLTAEQLAENARIARGELIGRIKDLQLNGNGWDSSASGWRCGQSVILLDLVSGEGDNPMAESLAKAQLIWPQVTSVFPGKGRALLQAVPWAFGPRTTAIVIQAEEEAGLLAGAEALARLPEDQMMPGIAAAKSALWQQYHVGGAPAPVKPGRLTSKGLTTRPAPLPFRIEFPGDKPVAAEGVKRPASLVHAAKALPATFTFKDYVLFYRVEGKLTETATVEFLNPDLRFSEAVMVVVEAKEPGKVKITLDGVFRYSDRKPCWQAQWEDIINLREQLVPKDRRPLEVEVQVAGKTVGKLVPSKTEEKEVPLELTAPTAGTKPKTVVEEVVLQLTGEIELTAGRQEVMLIHKNVVDGKLDQVIITGIP